MKYILLCLIFVNSLSLVADNDTFFKPVIEKMLERGVDSTFIKKIINSPKSDFNEKFVRINVTGYLKKPDYSPHYNLKAQKKCKEFLNENLQTLQKAEDKYSVPKEVITSVLWIETRHGGYLGYNHVVSVYLSTAMANQEKYIKMNQRNLKVDFEGSEEELHELEEKIVARANKKANWALDQLVALEKLDKISPIPVLDIEGSWAGAFGMSQFLPESYIKWAVDGDGDGSINLFETKDAIFSVANYLKTNGWGETLEEQRKAVFHYNNSTAYVDAVLKLAEYTGHELPDKSEEKVTQKNIKTPLDKQVE